MNESLLEARRQALGLTWAEVAERAGINVTTIWRWRKGRESPRMRQAMRLAAALKLNVNQLWRDQP